MCEFVSQRFQGSLKVQCCMITPCLRESCKVVQTFETMASWCKGAMLLFSVSGTVKAGRIEGWAKCQVEANVTFSNSKCDQSCCAGHLYDCLVNGKGFEETLVAGDKGTKVCYVQTLTHVSFRTMLLRLDAATVPDQSIERCHLKSGARFTQPTSNVVFSVKSWFIRFPRCVCCGLIVVGIDWNCFTHAFAEFKANFHAFIHCCFDFFKTRAFSRGYLPRVQLESCSPVLHTTFAIRYLGHTYA